MFIISLLLSSLSCSRQPEYTLEIRNLQKAVKKNPSDQNSYKALIKTLYDKEYFKESARCAEEFLNIYSGDFAGILYLGFANEKLKKWDIAEKYYKILCIKFTETGEGYYRLAILQYKMGDYKGSIENLEKAMALLVTDTKISIEIMSFLAEAYYYSGNPKKAYEILDKAIELDPFNKDILYTYAVWLLREGKYKESIQYLDKLISQNPQEEFPYIRLGKAYYNLRDLDNAEKAFFNASRFDSAIKILSDIIHVQKMDSTYSEINTAAVKINEKYEYKYGDKYYIRGIAENIGLETAERVSIIVRVYDKKNKIIAQKVFDFSPKNVRPEQYMFFSIDIPYAEDISDIKIESNWHKRATSMYLK
jgi:tetratricopeptide (TPR) repeat protein